MNLFPAKLKIEEMFNKNLDKKEIVLHDEVSENGEVYYIRLEKTAHLATVTVTSNEYTFSFSYKGALDERFNMELLDHRNTIRNELVD